MTDPMMQEQQQEQQQIGHEAISNTETDSGLRQLNFASESVNEEQEDIFDHYNNRYD